MSQVAHSQLDRLISAAVEQGTRSQDCTLPAYICTTADVLMSIVEFIGGHQVIVRQLASMPSGIAVVLHNGQLSVLNTEDVGDEP